MKITTTFKRQQTNKTWKIFYNTNSETEYAIYLMEYVVKNEAPFNIGSNNHRKDVKDPKAVLADKHLQKMDLTSTQDSQ